MIRGTQRNQFDKKKKNYDQFILLFFQQEIKIGQPKRLGKL